MSNPFRWRHAAFILCALCLGGCSDLIDPYVRLQDPTPEPAAPGSGPHQADYEQSHNALSNERGRALALANAYGRAAEHQAELTTGLAATLIPLNALALFQASTVHNNSVLVPAIGFSSSAALGVGDVLRSPTREAIYVEGRAAVFCSLSASDPFLVSQHDYVTFLADSRLQQHVVEVDEAKANLATAIQVYTQAEPAVQTANPAYTAPDAAIQASAQGIANLGAAQPSLDQATSAQTTINALAEERRNVDSASWQLEARLRGITVEVDRQVLNTEVSMDQLRTALGAAALASTQASSAPATPAPAAAGTTNATKVAQAQGAMDTPAATPSPNATMLKNAADRLATALVVLANDAAFIAESNTFLAHQTEVERSSGQLGACSVAAVAILNAVAPTPAQAQAGGTDMLVQVHSPQGVGAPSASVSATDGTVTATVTAPQSGYNYVVDVHATDKAVLGARTLVIWNADGLQQVTINFTVVAKPATGA